MRIDFETKHNPVSEFDEGGVACYIVGGKYEARLVFKHGGFKVTYYGDSYHDIVEAAMAAIQSFLDGEIFDREIWMDGMRWDAKPIVEFGPMAPEIKEIIEQAIDLKTGGDRNKLTGLMALPA